MANTTQFSAEWQTLQNNCEQYEMMALLIKLTSMLLTAACLAFDASFFWLSTLLFSCWGVEAIVKTYQSRLTDRLLLVEAQISATMPESTAAMQLHTHWTSNRPRGLQILREYGLNGLRPTIAFPYALLVSAGAMAAFMTR